MYSSSNVKSETLVTKIEKIQSFVTTINSEKYNFNNINKQLEVIKSYLTEDKLRIQIVGLDNNSTKGCTQLLQSDRNIPKSYDIETIIFPKQPIISYRDILCLVISSEEKLSKEAKHLLKYLSESPVIQLIIFIDLLDNEKETLEDIKNYITQIESKIKEHNPQLEFKIFSVALKHHYPKPEVKPDAKTKNLLNNICKEIENIAKLKRQEVLFKGAQTLINKQVELLKNILECEEATINRQKSILENKIKNPKFSYNDVKKEVDILYRKSFKEIDKFFKLSSEQIKIFVEKILDEHSIDSINNRLEDQLKSIQLTRREPSYNYFLRGGEATLKLNDKNSLEIHEDIVYFYRDIMNQNFISQWIKICDSYYNNGLNGLRSNLYQDFNSSIGNLVSPPRELKNKVEQRTISSFFSPNKKKHFDWETTYKRPGIFGFLLKETRGQVMMGTMMISMLGKMATNLIESTNQTNNQEEGGFEVLALILPMIFVLVFFGSILTYISTCDSKEKQEVEKIKKTGYDYYKSLGKSYVSKLQSYLVNQLSMEEQNLKDILEDFKYNLSEYITETENKIREHEKILTELGNKKRELNNLLR